MNPLLAPSPALLAAVLATACSPDVVVGSPGTSTTTTSSGSTSSSSSSSSSTSSDPCAACRLPACVHDVVAACPPVGPCTKSEKNSGFEVGTLMCFANGVRWFDGRTDYSSTTERFYRPDGAACYWAETTDNTTWTFHDASDAVFATVKAAAGGPLVKATCGAAAVEIDYGSAPCAVCASNALALPKRPTCIEGSCELL